LDLREPAAAEKSVNDTLQRFGRIDALVNIAGGYRKSICFPRFILFVQSAVALLSLREACGLDAGL
jgi:NAD(P)-dependent dehydrogenase (short-subunit alcohol dehydrogenase family)